MKIAIFLIGLAVLVASAESSPFHFQRRSLSPEAQFRNAIEEGCVRNLELSPEETATMEKVQQLQQSNSVRIRSQEDVDRLIDQEAPNSAVANSLKPKVASLVTCIANEFKKMLGLRRRR